MGTFDTGSGWKDKDESEFEKSLNLTKDETRILHEMEALHNKLSSEYVFWMREFQAKGDDRMKEYHFQNVKLYRQYAEMFEWLRTYMVKGEWMTSNALIGEIVCAGVEAVFHKHHGGAIASVLQMKLLDSMPDVVQQAVFVEKIRLAIEARKKLEDDKLKEIGG